MNAGLASPRRMPFEKLRVQRMALDPLKQQSFDQLFPGEPFGQHQSSGVELEFLIHRHIDQLLVLLGYAATPVIGPSGTCSRSLWRGLTRGKPGRAIVGGLRSNPTRRENGHYLLVAQFLFAFPLLNRRFLTRAAIRGSVMTFGVSRIDITETSGGAGPEKTLQAAGQVRSTGTLPSCRPWAHTGAIGGTR